MPHSTHIDDVLDHKSKVGGYMTIFNMALMKRAIEHDFSKFKQGEIEHFEEVNDALQGLTYGSDEYKASLKKIKPAIDHHYEVNSHHPEHFPNGIEGMDLLDIVEMVCDWCGAVKRHADGDIYESLEINKERFNIDDQLYSIIKNTVDLFEKISGK